LGVYRSVPTEDEILVPETLLKKRKSQEKAREERQAEFDKKKKVGSTFLGDMLLSWGKLRTAVLICSCFIGAKGKARSYL